MTDELFHPLLELQHRFLTELWGVGYNLDDFSRITRTRTVGLALMTELAEFMAELPIKEHRLYHNQDVNRHNLTEEIVDILKYLLGLALLWGVDAEELTEVWYSKSDIVEQRLNQERALVKMQSQNQQIAVLDLDGVLLDTHTHWLDHLDRRTGQVFQTRREARLLLGNNRYERLKDGYRRKNKRDVPQVPWAKDLTHQLHRDGYGVVVITARPYSRYSNLWQDTVASLQGVYYDVLFFDDDKRTRIERFSSQVSMVVEDDVSHAVSLVNPWTTVFLVTNEENKDDLIPNEVTRVDSLRAVWRLVK